MTLKSHFCGKNVIILSLCMQRCYGRHNIFRKSVNCGLSILLHGVISLSKALGYLYCLVSVVRNQVVGLKQGTLWLEKYLNIGAT